MGGGGKGGNKSGGKLEDIAEAFFAETTPLRQTMQDQFLEALTTGGSQARIPIIGKAEEQSRQATSRSMNALDADLARTGLAGTPFGARTRAETIQRGDQATSMIPTNIVMQMLQQIPGYVTGANQTVVTGMGQAAGAEAQTQQAQGNYLGAMLSPFKFGFGG
jgi:hypothetical protein